MKISLIFPRLNTNIQQEKPKSSPTVSSPFWQNLPKTAPAYFDGVYYRSLLNIKQPSFCGLEYKTISSKKPIYTPCCTNYKNIEEFSKQFVEKINTQIQNPTLQDIEKLLANVQKATGADEELTKEVVFRLSQFSSFKSAKYINEVLKERKERNIVTTSFPCLENCLVYLNEKFNFMNNRHDNRNVFFVDDYALKTIEAEQTDCSKTPFDDFLSEKYYVLDGFDIVARDKKCYGANFLSGTGYLESVSVDVIKQIQKGKDKEEIFNGDIINRFKKLYPDYADKIEVIKKPIPKSLTASDILENLTENTLNEDNVARKILTSGFKYKTDLRDSEYMSGATMEEILTALMKYLDVYGIAFSAHSMSEHLNNAGKKLKGIEKSTGRKNVYCIPFSQKSYSLLTYMFMKNNQIPPEQAVESYYRMYTKDDNFVIVDDSTISGDSEIKAIKKIDNTINAKSTKSDNIYFVPMVASTTAVKYSKSNLIPLTTTKDMVDVFDEYIIGYLPQSEKEQIESKQTYKGYGNMFYKDFCILSLALDLNYGTSGTAIAFPYILPDNNSDFSSEILEPLLVESTHESRKS